MDEINERKEVLEFLSDNEIAPVVGFNGGNAMMNVLSIKNMLRSKFALGLIFAIGCAAIAAPAYAHYIYEAGFTYTSGYGCTWNRAEISHGNGGGYSKSDVRSKRVFTYDGYTFHCGTDLSRPIGHLRAKWRLYKLNGSSWQTCKSSNYSYNTSNTAHLKVDEYHGYNPPCCQGIYRTVAYGHFKSGSSWYGGSLSSGVTGHTLP